MKLSALLTINDRSPEISSRVARSFLANRPDEMIIVLDRPTKDARDGAIEAYGNFPWPTKFVTIDGEPGWKCPARAWNAAFGAASGGLLLCVSSDVIQKPDNMSTARRICEDGKTALFGACENLLQDGDTRGAEGEIMVCSMHPRPIGFIMCLPAASVAAIDGNDETFMDGLWYEDADFTQRLWETDIDFVFDDSVHGLHIHHDRPLLDTEIGHEMVARNASLMIEKHGTLMPWWKRMPIVSRWETPQNRPGRLRWSHA